MSGVAAYTVGFLQSRPLTHKDTHTSSVAGVIHAALQMHITTSPSRHLHSCSHLRHTKLFSFFPEILAATVKTSQNSQVMNKTVELASFCASEGGKKKKRKMFHSKPPPPAQKKKTFNFLSVISFNSKAPVTVIGTFCCKTY